MRSPAAPGLSPERRMRLGLPSRRMSRVGSVLLVNHHYASYLPDVEGPSDAFITGAGGSSSTTPAAASASAPTDTPDKSGLAPPLPHTTLGDGISEGATDPAIVTASTTGDSVTNSAASSTGLTAPPTNDRTDSLASVTAIRHGHAGARDSVGPSPLAQETVAAAAISEASTDGPGSSTAVESDHPSTTASPRRDDSAIADSSPVLKTADLLPAKPAENGTTANSAASPTSPSAKPAALAAVGNKEAEKGHRRASSTSSNGKKKTGFMNKLKGEMKVISGKIGGDEAKVQAGERLKHGGESLASVTSSGPS